MIYMNLWNNQLINPIYTLHVCMYSACVLLKSMTFLFLSPPLVCKFNIERQNSISNGRIQYHHLGTSLVLTSKVIQHFFATYLLFFLRMKEQVIHSLRPVGKCNPACYPRPSVIPIQGWLRLDIRPDWSF